MKLKKILALVVAGAIAASTMITSAFAAEEYTLFEEEHILASDWSSNIIFDTAKISDVDITGEITITYDTAAAGMQLKIAEHSGWTSLKSAYPTGKGDYCDITAGTTEFKFTFSEEDAAKAKSNGFLIGGKGGTIRKVTVKIEESGGDETTADSGTEPQPEGKGIAFIGDSIGAGNNWGKTFDRDDIVNLSVGGATSKDVAERQFPKLYTNYEGFDAVFIICGVNDWNLDGFGSTTTYENSMNNFKKMFDLAKENMPDANIYVTGPFPVLGDQAHNMTNGALPGYHEKLEEVCEDYENVTFLGECWDALYDTETKLGKEDLYNSDGLHINADGYEAVAAVMQTYVDAISAGTITPIVPDVTTPVVTDDTTPVVTDDTTPVVTDDTTPAPGTSDDNKGDDKNPATGVALIALPVILAAAGMTGAGVILKKRK